MQETLKLHYSKYFRYFHCLKGHLLSHPVQRQPWILRDPPLFLRVCTLRNVKCTTPKSGIQKPAFKKSHAFCIKRSRTHSVKWAYFCTILFALVMGESRELGRTLKLCPWTTENTNYPHMLSRKFMQPHKMGKLLQKEKGNWEFSGCRVCILRLPFVENNQTDHINMENIYR